MGLSTLWQTMTPAELLIWQAYFHNQEEDRKIADTANR